MQRMLSENSGLPALAQIWEEKLEQSEHDKSKLSLEIQRGIEEGVQFKILKEIYSKTESRLSVGNYNQKRDLLKEGFAYILSIDDLTDRDLDYIIDEYFA